MPSFLSLPPLLHTRGSLLVGREVCGVHKLSAPGITVEQLVALASLAATKVSHTHVCVFCAMLIMRRVELHCYGVTSWLRV